MKNKNLLNNAPFGQKNKLGITYQINILLCGNLQSLLIKRGEERARDFSWEKTTREIIEVYKEVLREN